MSKEIRLDPDRNRIGYGVIVAINSALVHETTAGFIEREDRFAANAAYDMDRVIREWIKIDERRPSWFKISGARVLELGSGSLHAVSRSRIETIYYPHFARFAAMNGAQVTAVGIVGQSLWDQTMFTGIKADLIPLVMNEKLSKLFEHVKKFDIIHSGSFVGDALDPSLQRNLESARIYKDDFEERLVEESAKILAEGGIIDHRLFPEHGTGIRGYRMVSGELQEEIFNR